MSVYISVGLRQHIRDTFANCCAYCKTPEALTATTFEIEHIRPRSAHGETAFDNLCLACPTCNRFKSHRQTATDPVTQQQVSLFHPHQQQWKDHFVWSKDATEIQALTPVGRATIAALKMNRPQLVRVRRMWIKMGEHGPEIE